jgi:hypothetical protein
LAKTSKSIQSAGIGPVVMIGAGLCAAVLFTILRQDTPQALALAHLTPLPLIISALGFGPAIGFGSAAVATLAVALLAIFREGALSSTAILIGLIMAAIFAIVQALPAWWLGFLSCLVRSDETARWHVVPDDKKSLPMIYYPIGHILVHAAAIIISLVALAIGASTLHYGSFNAAVAHLAARISPIIEKLVELHPELLSGFDIHALTLIFVAAMPAVIAAWCLTALLANLWLAGRIVQTSSRLRRPWPNIARELSLPRLLVLALAGAIGLCFVKSWPGMIGLIAAVTLGLLYAMQGLAVIHDLTRGWKWRGFTLSGIYAMLIVFVPWPLAFFAVFGLADSAFSFRDRKAAAVLASKP